MLELRDDPNKQFELAIKSFQRYAGLNVTGKWFRTNIQRIDHCQSRLDHEAMGIANRMGFLPGKCLSQQQKNATNTLSNLPPLQRRNTSWVPKISGDLGSATCLVCPLVKTALTTAVRPPRKYR